MSGQLSQTDFSIPEWQIELVEEALQSITDGTAELEWEEAKKQFYL
jgi:hypothetical protein